MNMGRLGDGYFEKDRKTSSVLYTKARKKGTQIPQKQLKICYMFLVLPLIVTTMFSSFLFAKLFFFFLMSVGCGFFFFPDFKFIYFWNLVKRSYIHLGLLINMRSCIMKKASRKL